jgi:hypothetical protein
MTRQDDSTAGQELLAQVQAIIKSLSNDRKHSRPNKASNKASAADSSDRVLGLNVPQMMEQSGAAAAAAASGSSATLSITEVIDGKRRELEGLHAELEMKLNELESHDALLSGNKPAREEAPSIQHKAGAVLAHVQSNGLYSSVTASVAPQVFSSRSTLVEVELRIKDKLRELTAFSESIKEMQCASCEDVQYGPHHAACDDPGGFSRDAMPEDHVVRKRGLLARMEERLEANAMQPGLSSSLNHEVDIHDILAACKKRNERSASSVRKLDRDENSRSVKSQLEEVEKTVRSKINRLK